MWVGVGCGSRSDTPPQAVARADERARAASREDAANRREMRAVSEDGFLAEAPEQAYLHGKFRPDHFKGFTPEQRAAVEEEQRRQRRELQARKAREAKEERDWDAAATRAARYATEIAALEAESQELDRAHLREALRQQVELAKARWVCGLACGLRWRGGPADAQRAAEKQSRATTARAPSPIRPPAGRARY